MVLLWPRRGKWATLGSVESLRSKATVEEVSCGGVAVRSAKLEKRGLGDRFRREAQDKLLLLVAPLVASLVGTLRV